MIDPNTAFTTEQQQRAEAATQAKEILRIPGFNTASKVYAFEVIELAQFILIGEIPLDVADGNDENDAEKGTQV